MIVQKSSMNVRYSCSACCSCLSVMDCLHINGVVAETAPPFYYFESGYLTGLPVQYFSLRQLSGDTQAQVSRLRLSIVVVRPTIIEYVSHIIFYLVTDPGVCHVFHLVRIVGD